MGYKELFKNRILAVFLVALVLRLGYVFLLPQAPPVADAMDYDSIAMNLASGHSFALNPDVPTPKRPPGFPFFLALVYSVFGHSFAAAAALQALLGALTCAAAFRTAEKLFGERTGELAGWLLAFYPVLIVYTGLLLTETLFTFLLASAVMFWVYGVSRRNYGDFALAGLLLGLATLTRPVTLIFPGVLLAVLLVSNRGLLAKWLLFLAVFLFTLAPWSARNYRLWGTLRPCSVGTGYGFFVTGNMAAGRSFDESVRMYLDRFSRYPEPKTFTPGAPAPAMQLENELQAEGGALVKANPGNFVKIALKRLPSFWLTSHSSVFGVDKPMGEYRREGRWLPVFFRLAMLGLQGLLLALAAAGLLLTRGRWRETAVLAALLVFFTGHVAFDFVPRYHLPVMPYLIMFAAAGLAGLLEKFRRPA